MNTTTTDTAQEPDAVEAAIISLLRAKWDTHRIAKQLSAAESFGNYGEKGYTYDEMKAKADAVCRQMNAAQKVENAAAVRQLREDFADLAAMSSRQSIFGRRDFRFRR